MPDPSVVGSFASDNLCVGKMHFAEARMAGCSLWPKQGWDGLFSDVRDAVIEHGGEVVMGWADETVLIEDGVVKGVLLGGDELIPDEIYEGEVIEAGCVIWTLPVWDVLRVVPAGARPDWYAPSRTIWAGAWTEGSAGAVERLPVACWAVHHCLFKEL